jgi:hypothetical protein
MSFGARSRSLVFAILSLLVIPLGVAAQDAGTPDAFAPTHRASAQQPVNLRSEPSLQAETVATLPPSTSLEIVDERIDEEGTIWVQARAADGSVGWLRKLDVSSPNQAGLSLFLHATLCPRCFQVASATLFTTHAASAAAKMSTMKSTKCANVSKALLLLIDAGTIKR